MEKLLPKENKSYSLDRILEITFLLLSLSLSLCLSFYFFYFIFKFLRSFSLQSINPVGCG